MKFLFSKKLNKNSKDGFRLNKRMATFLVCLLVSIFFWLLMTLSKDYNVTFNFPINYSHFPSDKIVSNNLPKFVDIEIKAKGFNLLKYSFFKKRDTIYMDMQDVRPLNTKNSYYLLSNARTDKITYQFSNDIKIVKISPDTIYINFNKKVNKYVPVKYDLTLSFYKQHNLADSIIIIPESIKVSGGADIINKINFVKTIPVVLKDLDASTTIKLVVLNAKENQQVTYSPSFVKAIINVTKYTEGSIELPIEVINLPRNYNLKVFPDKIAVKYKVAFENFEKINASQFRAVVDFNKIDNNSNKLKITLTKTPAEISAVKLDNDKVEFIINK
ncbi:MAG: CdaR family protein [Bacteroidia bacterium]